MKKQKKYKICRGLFFLVFLMEISGRLAFWGMAAEKESAETQTGAAGAYYEEDAFTVLLETEYAEKKVSLKEAFHWCPEYLQGLRVKEVELSPGLYLTEEDPGDFTGERANGQFRVCLEINERTAYRRWLSRKLVDTGRGNGRSEYDPGVFKSPYRQ